MSDSCNHKTVYVNCSSAAADAGFVRPSLEERTLAMSKTGRLARMTYLAKEDAVNDNQTFSGPLALPGDHLAEHPREQGQSCKDWFAIEATQRRQQAISNKNRIYLCGPPNMKYLPEQMQSMMNPYCPILPQGVAPGPERWTCTLKQYRQLTEARSLAFTPQTSAVGFKFRDDGKTFEIRHRPPPDGLARMQLNVSDLRTALVQIKAQAAHSVVMVIRPERLDLDLVRFSELRQLSIEVNVLNFAIIDPAHVDEIAQLVLLQPVSEREGW
ncbi:hypothetical protein FDENT_9136 [Fusarium denticulatum]|uniref:Uncharacterized protein n=1 Tax=Fusarium denticulatum TaxID=48507 RepID=A0A8H5X1K3_9HYPO|nr:hypothetical protein FDENT_9136 [Fusarium denticulatum]